MNTTTKTTIGVLAAVSTLVGITQCNGSSATPAAASSTYPAAPSTTTSSTPAAPSTTPMSAWPTTAPGATPPASTTPTGTTGTAPATTPVPTPPAPGAPVRARVKAFVTAIVSTQGITREAYATKLAGYTDTELAQRLALTDPVNIPTQKVTGEPQLLYTSATEAVSGWFVPTSTIGYTVTTSAGGGQLQMVAVEPGRIAPTTYTPTDDD